MMGLPFSQRPKSPYVPPMSGAKPTLLGNPGITPAADPGVASPPRTAVRRNLPGWGETYLDAEFAPKIDAFVQNARDQGVQLEFTSGYRSPEKQKALRDLWLEKGSNGTGLVAQPAEKSRHSTGLAVDVRYNDLSAATQQIIRDAAQKAGLTWGGTFPQPDPVHFEYIPPGFDFDSYVDNFSNAVRSVQP